MFAAILCGLLCGCDRVDSVRLEWKPDIGTEAASRVAPRLSDALLEIEHVASGVAMFATAACLYVRDGGAIIVPSSPVDLW